MWYFLMMSTILPFNKTVTVPLNGEAQMPLLNDEDREAFIRSLQDAEKSIDRGEFALFDHDSFLAKLRANYASHLTGK
jgi:hypothetical protein